MAARRYSGRGSATGIRTEINGRLCWLSISRLSLDTTALLGRSKVLSQRWYSPWSSVAVFMLLVLRRKRRRPEALKLWCLRADEASGEQRMLIDVAQEGPRTEREGAES